MGAIKNNLDDPVDTMYHSYGSTYSYTNNTYYIKQPSLLRVTQEKIFFHLLSMLYDMMLSPKAT